MAKKRKWSGDDEDAASMEMELAEVAERDEALKGLTSDMACLLNEIWCYLVNRGPLDINGDGVTSRRLIDGLEKMVESIDKVNE